MEVSDKGGDKFHITPDLRKGTISLFKGPDDQHALLLEGAA